MADIPKKDAKVNDTSQISPAPNEDAGDACALCNLSAKRTFEPIEIMPGGSMTIVREDPTSAIVRFKAGSLEPAHHHTFGHDLIVNYGRKCVWNLTKNATYELGPGDFLYTPAGDIHRVQYLTDTEFFIKWDGHWNLFLDEDINQASAAIHASNDIA
ncbi:hypothetical protein KP509_23G016600 [Ceratopteris richardii]|nr:hypothetical protein KP509_23G016600 [Ceratopteris richardii]